MKPGMRPPRSLVLRITPDDDGRSYPPSAALYRAFYKSQPWKKLAYQVKIECGWQCQCCGVTADDGVRIVSDHKQPARFYWHLRLERANIQVLCEECNLGKASWDETDYRLSVKERMLGAIEYCEKHDRGTPLKQAIIAAHSFGALSAEDAIGLIHRNGLVRS